MVTAEPGAMSKRWKRREARSVHGMSAGGAVMCVVVLYLVTCVSHLAAAACGRGAQWSPAYAAE